MLISKLLLMVSEDCNFNCRYCYQTREKKQMTRQVLDHALKRFLPAMKKSFGVFFVGGEPLLNPDLIRYAVDRLEDESRRRRKVCRLHLTTNGSLLDGDWIEWLNAHRFNVGLSFDGPAQDRGRRPGSFEPTVNTLDRLLSAPRIGLIVNSVFYPETIGVLSGSLAFLLETGAPRISLGLDLHRPWSPSAVDELSHEFSALTDVLEAHWRKAGTLPVDTFPDLSKRGIWRCDAGLGQVTVTAEGDLWGCPLFYEHFKGRENEGWYRRYHLGRLDGPWTDPRPLPPAVIKNYRLLSQDNFHTSNRRCFLCDDLEKCGVCPMVSAAHSNDPGRVPEFICRINRIAIREKMRLQEAIGQPSPENRTG